MKKIITLLLILILSQNVYAYDTEATLREVKENTDISSLTYAPIGGEWSVLYLVKSGVAKPSEFGAYKEKIAELLKTTQGEPDKRKYTSYSRLILALNALGSDPKNIEGYDLYSKLEDYEKVISQGLNGAVFALIALNNGNISTPVKERYISYILSRQKSDGGFSLMDESEPDVTAMVLQSLAPFTYKEDVKEAVNKALDYLSKAQLENGGYEAYGSETSEYTSQVIIALTALNIDPQEDERFIKNASLIDNIYSYRTKKGFAHTPWGETNAMATEQACCALTSYKLFKEGKGCIYSPAASYKAVLEGLLCVC